MKELKELLHSAHIAMPWQTASVVPEHVTGGIYRGPRPDFAELQKAKIGTIISLENDVEVVTAEKQTAESLGMAFVNCPLSETTPPSPADLKNIVNHMNILRQNGVYVHCRRGIDRTGYAIAAYRILDEEWSFASAYREVLEHGHSEVYYFSWRPSLEALSN